METECGAAALMKVLVVAGQYKRQSEELAARNSALEIELAALRQEIAVMREIAQAQAQQNTRSRSPSAPHPHRHRSPTRQGGDAAGGVSMAWSVSSNASDDDVTTQNGSFPVHAEYLLRDASVARSLKVALAHRETRALAEALVAGVADAERARNQELIHRKRELESLVEAQQLRRCASDCVSRLSAFEKAQSELVRRQVKKMSETIHEATAAVRTSVVEYQRARTAEAEAEHALNMARGNVHRPPLATQQQQYNRNHNQQGYEISGASAVPHRDDVSTLPSRSANDSRVLDGGADSTLPDAPSAVGSSLPASSVVNVNFVPFAVEKGGGVGSGARRPPATFAADDTPDASKVAVAATSTYNNNTNANVTNHQRSWGGSPAPGDHLGATVQITVADAAAAGRSPGGAATPFRTLDDGSEAEMRRLLEHSKAQVKACDLAKAVAALQIANRGKGATPQRR